MTPADDATPRQEIEPPDDGEGGYRLVGWDEKGPVEPVPLSCGAGVSPAKVGGTPGSQDGSAGETPAPQPTDEPTREPYRLPPLPPKPFLTGTFSFPLSAGARVHGLLLLLGAMVVFQLAAKSLGLGDSPGLLTWISSALFWVMTVILAMLWFTFASACALAVVRDTANGLIRITTWPAWDILDYLVDPLYLFNSLCASVLPGVALDRLLAHFGLPNGMLAPAGALLLFPIVLLSMLESGSPLGAISGPVWRTLVVAARGWAAFYLAAAALLAVVGAVATISQWFGGPWGTIVAAATVAAGWLVYFRLLGRLAWYCADRTAEAEPEAEPDEEAEAEAAAGQGRGGQGEGGLPRPGRV